MTTFIVDEQPEQDPAVNPEDHGEMAALICGGLAAAAAKEKKLITATFQANYEKPGTSNRFRSPVDGRKLGQVLSTDPDPAWAVTDMDALLTYLAEEFPALQETVYELHTPAGSLTLGPLDELTMILLEHAPEMLHEAKKIPGSAVIDALTQSRATGKAAGPGIKLLKAGSEVRVLPDKNILEAFPALIAGGYLRFEGTRPVLELPAAPEPDVPEGA